MTQEKNILITKKGLKIYARRPRKGIVSDLDIIKEVLINDRYGIKKLGYPEVVVDIGAHIGTFSLAVAKMFPNAKIIAYEPLEENYQLLEKNIVFNDLGNIIPRQRALSGKKGEITIFVNALNTGGHSSFPIRKRGIKVKVKSVTLKNVFVENDLKKIDLLKIDCEGGEYDILQKTPKDVLQKVKEIIFELHETEEIARQHHSPSGLLNFLRNAGYLVKVIEEIYYEDEGRFWTVRAKYHGA